MMYGRDVAVWRSVGGAEAWRRGSSYRPQGLRHRQGTQAWLAECCARRKHGYILNQLPTHARPPPPPSPSPSPLHPLLHPPTSTPLTPLSFSFHWLQLDLSSRKTYSDYRVCILSHSIPVYQLIFMHLRPPIDQTISLYSWINPHISHEYSHEYSHKQESIDRVYYNYRCSLSTYQSRPICPPNKLPVLLYSNQHN